MNKQPLVEREAFAPAANINGTLGPDLLVGTPFDDTITGHEGDDTLQGGAGIDVAVFEGTSSGYRIDSLASGLYIADIYIANGDTGIDLLSQIETLRFGDDLTIGIDPLQAEHSGEVRVNASNYKASAPTAASLIDGSYVVTWQALNPNGDVDIFFRIFDATGNPKTGDVLANTQTFSNQLSPSISALSNGGFALIWSTGDIRAQVFNSLGDKHGNEFQVTPDPAYKFGVTASVASLDDGKFVVVWNDSEIHAQIFSYGGEQIGSVIDVNGIQRYGQGQASVSGLPNGDFVIAWRTNRGATEDISVKKYSSAGQPITNEIPLNARTGAENPDVTALVDGGYIVTWNGTGALYNARYLFAQRFDSNNNKIGTEITVYSSSNTSPQSTSVAPTLDGGFVVTWQSKSNDASDGDIYVFKYDQNNHAIGSAVLVNSTQAGNQTAPDVVTLANGDQVVVWQNQGIDIQSQRIYEDGTHSGIELFGSAFSEVINGGMGSQIIFGFAGDDTIRGGSNADQLVGGDGSDTYILDDPSDLVIEELGQEADQDSVFSYFNYTLPENLENLILLSPSGLQGTGNALANRIVGNEHANKLYGGVGDDTLNGASGDDIMSGGPGSDVYFVDSVNDIVVGEKSSSVDVDVVKSSVTWTLMQNIENLTLIGSEAIDGYGNASRNKIIGNNASNFIDGRGGADTMIGGFGDDTYFVDRSSDKVRESSSDRNEIDTIISLVSRTLGANQEVLMLVGADPINGIGNRLANTLSGNSDQNVLDGRRGLDTASYADADAGVHVTLETSEFQNTRGDGFDKLLRIENITGSKFADKLTGNARANVLDGGSGDDTLIGGGGDDVLIGGGGFNVLDGGNGNDRYVVTTLDQIIEYSGADSGIDTIVSDVSYILPANIENLELAGLGNINGTGNGSDNQILGNDGSNLLIGFKGNDTLVGGAGSDTLQGGAGADTFRFDASPASGADVDHIDDFNPSNDLIALSKGGFEGLGSVGELNPDAFVSGPGLSAALDVANRVIFDSTSGALYYDADGTGPIAAVRFAVVTEGLILASDNFVVY